MTVVKVLVQRIGIVISVISVYAPQFSFDNQKDYFYDSLINVVRKLGETKIEVIAGDFNGDIGNNLENYEAQHGGY